MEASSASASSFYSSSAYGQHYHHPPPSSFHHHHHHPAFDEEPPMPPPPPPPSSSSPAPFPYTRHLDGFLHHKDWTNVQDTVKDALFFCARALQEQHQEIFMLKQQQRESQEKERERAAALALERKVGTLAAAVDDVQHQERDMLLALEVVRAEAKEKRAVMEEGMQEIRDRLYEEMASWDALRAKSNRLEAKVEDATQILHNLQQPLERQEEEEQEEEEEGKEGRKEEGEEEWKERLQVEVETTVLERVEAGKVASSKQLAVLSARMERLEQAQKGIVEELKERKAGEEEVLRALEQKTEKEETEDLRELVEHMDFHSRLALASSSASSDHAKESDKEEKDKAALLLLQGKVTRLTHGLQALHSSLAKHQEESKKKPKQEGNHSRKHPHLLLPSSLPPSLASPALVPLVGRWLWKSGARRMITRRGGWVLWERQVANPALPPSLQAKALPSSSCSSAAAVAAAAATAASPSFAWQPMSSGVGVSAGGLYHLVVGVFTSRKASLLQVFLNNALLFSTIAAAAGTPSSFPSSRPSSLQTSLTPYGDVAPSLSLSQYVSLPAGGTISVKVDVEEEEEAEEGGGREGGRGRALQGFLQLTKL